MLKYIVIFTLSINYSFSQNQEIKQVFEKESVTKIISEEKSNVEPTLNPEEQGFTKIVRENKIIYRKEVNGIIVEFIPEEK